MVATYAIWFMENTAPLVAERPGCYSQCTVEFLFVVLTFEWGLKNELCWAPPSLLPPPQPLWGLCVLEEEENNALILSCVQVGRAWKLEILGLREMCWLHWILAQDPDRGNGPAGDKILSIILNACTRLQVVPAVWESERAKVLFTWNISVYGNSQ